jgi:hypothetical protein
MRVYRVGSDRPVRMGFAHRRGRTDWQRALLYCERCDSPAVAYIFSRAVECFGFAVSSPARFCQVCVMKHRPFRPRSHRCAQAIEFLQQHGSVWQRDRDARAQGRFQRAVITPLVVTLTMRCDVLLRRVEFGAGKWGPDCPKCLSNVSPPANSAWPFGSKVAVSPMRDLLILPVLDQVSVERSRSAANPFVSSFGYGCAFTIVTPPATRIFPVGKSTAALSQLCLVVVHDG